MNVCVWGAWYGSRNVGDQALLISLAQELCAHDPRAEITVISKNTRHIRAYMEREGLRVRPVSKVRDFFRMVCAIRDADVFLFGGGVPFYDQWIHVGIMWFLTTLARLFKTPVVTLGVAAQYLKDPISRALYRRMLDRFEYVTVRDARTREEFEKLGIERDLPVVGDVAFLMKAAASDRVDRILEEEGISPERPLIFVVPRRITALQPFARAHYRRLKRTDAERMLTRLAHAADRLTDFGQVVFMPFHTLEPDNDLRMAEDVIARMRHADRVNIIRRQCTPPEALGLLQRGSFLLGSRLHSIILSASAGCPCVMAAFDLKHFGIANLLGLDEYVLDLTNDHGPTPEELMERAWRNRESTRDQLNRRVATLREEIRATLLRAIDPKFLKQARRPVQEPQAK